MQARRRAAVVPVAALLTACFCGCGGERQVPGGAAAPEPKQPAVHLDSLAGVASNAGTYYVAWRSEPETIPVGEPFDLSVWILEGPGGGAPVGDATLAVSARAIQHLKWMDADVVVAPAGPGRFDAEGLVFHLPGVWEIYFDVTQEGVTERAQHRLRVPGPLSGADSPESGVAGADAN